MNRKLIILLVLALAIVALVAVKIQTPAQPVDNADKLTYQPVAVQEETIQLNLGPGTIFADSHFSVQSGKLISVLVSSTMAGTLNFAGQDGVVISRPVAITPHNQFYIPSDKPGKYDITFDVPTGTYVLGTLTVMP